MAVDVIEAIGAVLPWLSPDSYLPKRFRAAHNLTHEPTVDWRPEDVSPDEGCKYWHSCLECPLPECCHIDPQGARDGFRNVLRDRVIHLAATGHDRRAIARYLDVAPRTVYRFIDSIPPGTITGTCEECGGETKAKKLRAPRFCGQACNNRYHNKRHVERARARREAARVS